MSPTPAMVVAQPTVEPAQPPFGAVVARQLSVWPFASRTQRLFLLVDPSSPEPTLREGLLRAMQQAYFRSDGCSQTRSVREAALAAHYVLRHRNRDVLPFDQVCAASAVAAVRGNLAFIALAGEAVAFAWRDGVLTGKRGNDRFARPLGLEYDPRIELWSTPLEPGDRLVVACGAVWSQRSRQAVEEILSADSPAELAEARLADALGGPRPAGVMVLECNVGVRASRRKPRIRVAAPGARWLSPLAALALLIGVAAVTVAGPSSMPSRLGLTQQAEALLAQVRETTDPYQARALAASAVDAALRGGSGDLLARATRELDAIDGVQPVAPAMAVRLGPSGSNVVDLAVGDTGLYTLDVVESSVRTFGLDARDQQATGETLVARAGAPLGSTGRRLAQPVAIQYAGGSQGMLMIVDQTRTVVQVASDHTLTVRALASAATWRELGALGADPDGRLLVLDSSARRLLEYPEQNQRPIDAPRIVLDTTRVMDLAFERVAEVVGQNGGFYMRMDDGSLRHFDASGSASHIMVRPPDGRPVTAVGITPDGAGGLYVADPLQSRIVQITADGAFVRQLRDASLAAVRQIKATRDGSRLYGLVASGVIVFDIPPQSSDDDDADTRNRDELR